MTAIPPTTPMTPMTPLHRPPPGPRGGRLPDLPPQNPRAQRRRVLYLVGLLPLLVALALTLKVVTMRHHDGAGLDAWRADDGATALEQYSANRSLNLFQRWLAPFDAGDAAFLLGDPARARGLFTTALETVPHKQECTVRINLALADEAIGDSAAKAGSRADAEDAWRAGITALDKGDCPHHAGLGKKQSKDAETVRKRLEDKLKQPPPQPKQNPQNQPKGDDQRGGSPKSKKEQRLQQRNDAGSRDHSRARDRDDYSQFSDQYSW